MVRKVTIIANCDVCYARGEEVPAIEQHTITIDSQQPRTVDLCPEHWEPFAPLVQLVSMVGNPIVEEPTRAGKQPNADQPNECPICHGVFSDRKHMRQHYYRQHPGQPKLRNWVAPAPAKIGKVDPINPLRCPECDFVAAKAQGLGAHRRAKHGVIGTSDYATRRREDLAQQEAMIG